MARDWANIGSFEFSKQAPSGVDHISKIVIDWYNVSLTSVAIGPRRICSASSRG